MSQLSDFLHIVPSSEYILLVVNNDLNTVEGNFDRESLDIEKLGKKLITIVKDPIWINFNEIATRTLDGAQLDLLGYSNEPVLIIKSLEPNNKGSYVIKFKSDSDTDISFGRDQKRLIENLALLWLEVRSNRLREVIIDDDNNQLNIYLTICKNQSIKIEDLKNKLVFLNEQGNLFYGKLFEYFLRNDLKAGMRVSLSSSAIDYLNINEMSFAELEGIAKPAFGIAKALYPHSSEIKIEDYYFIADSGLHKTDEIESASIEPLTTELLDLEQTMIPSESNILKDDSSPNENILPVEEFTVQLNESDTKLLKTTQLLDRYEQAVNVLVANRTPIMGKNIAAVCNPKISAPALTDSIIKHKERIVQCLQKYPDQWTLLRTNYLPVRKLLLDEEI